MLPQVSDYKPYEVICYAWQRERCLIRQLNKKPFPQDFDVAIAVEFGDPSLVRQASRTSCSRRTPHDSTPCSIPSLVSTAARLEGIPYINVEHASL